MEGVRERTALGWLLLLGRVYFNTHMISNEVLKLIKGRA